MKSGLLTIVLLVGCGAAQPDVYQAPPDSPDPDAFCMKTTAKDGVWVLAQGVMMPRPVGGVVVRGGCVEPHQSANPMRRLKVEANDNAWRLTLDTGKVCYEAWTAIFSVSADGASLSGDVQFKSRCGLRGGQWKGPLVLEIAAPPVTE